MASEFRAVPSSTLILAKILIEFPIPTSLLFKLFAMLVVNAKQDLAIRPSTGLLYPIIVAREEWSIQNVYPRFYALIEFRVSAAPATIVVVELSDIDEAPQGRPQACPDTYSTHLADKMALFR